MTEENKAELKADEAAVNTEAKDDETTAIEGQKPEINEESKQLEADLKREREAREKAEKASADLAFKLREKKRNDDEDDSNEEQPLTVKQLEAILARERESTRKELFSSEINRTISEISSNETERELIMEVYKNRSFPEHLSLREQIEECYVLANKKKILGENMELKRALRGKKGASNDSSTTFQEESKANQPKLPANDMAEMARVGFKWNGTSRRFEKKLTNGDLLVKDPKSRQTQLVKA